MKTYNNDDSFFMCIKIPFSYIGVNEIKSWFQQIFLRKQRLIIDEELDLSHANLEQRLEWYPGISTISVVTNPWARVYIAYNHVRRKETFFNQLASLEFNEFISTIDRLEIDDSYNFWYNPLASQASWLESKDKKADYIFKVENLDEEFKVIQEYFKTTDKIIWYDRVPEYKQHYNSRSIEIVEKLFKEDIEKFGYSFD